MSFLDEIAARLVSEGVGTLDATAASAIFKGSKAVIPSGLGPFISIAETGGTRPMKSQRSPKYQRPSAQIVVRSTSRAVARAKAKAAYDALGSASGGLYNVTLGGTFYVSIEVVQEPFDLGLDSDGRPRIAFNINAVKLAS